MTKFKRFIYLLKRYDSQSSILITLVDIFDAIIPGMMVLVLSKLMLMISLGDWNKTLYMIVVVALLQLTKGILGEIRNTMRVRMMAKVRKGFLRDFTHKLDLIKIELMENQKVIDLKARVLDKPDEKIVFGFSGFIDIISILVSILIIMAIIFEYSHILSGFILLMDIPIVILAYRNGKKNYVENKNAVYHRRYYSYLERIQFERETIAEQKIFDSFKLINRKWREENVQASKMEMRAFLKYFLSIRVGSFCINFVLLGLLIMLGKMFAEEERTLFVSLMGYLISSYQIQTESLPFAFSSFAKTLEYVADEFEFSNLEEKRESDSKHSKTEIAKHIIEFKNVSFSYPNSESDTLHNINMTINLNGHYAFVGKNGSGKSTIMKLIVGLYNDYSGDILLDGIDLREYTSSEIHKFFSVVFQKYTKYPLSIKDNVAIANNEKDSFEEVVSAVNAMGIKEAVLGKNRGFDTLLWKSDSGYSDLSEGQWQRLAVARCLYLDSIMRILDEPTAAIDPNQEKAFFEDYASMSKSSGTILISHRLASVKSADTIFVMDNGTIVEEGSHDELIKKRGLYYSMFSEQEKWYVQ